MQVPTINCSHGNKTTDWRFHIVPSWTNIWNKKTLPHWTLRIFFISLRKILYGYMVNAGDIIIAYTSDRNLRHVATSGGIGSRIIKELFTNNYICSAISYTFNKGTRQYEPQIIYDWDSYTPIGSIYHEIELFKFIKENIGQIKSPFLCTALPCQVAAIRKFLEKNGIEAYIIELTCSSQQSYEATEYMLKRAGVKTEEVEHIRYRGGGWPGGFTVTKVGGEELFFSNNSSVWTKIFHSRLFSMPRCFFCHASRQAVSDIQLADPWGIDTGDTEKEGRTLCKVNSQRMSDLLNSMSGHGDLEYEIRKKADFYSSQMGTIVSKNFNLKHPRLTRCVMNTVSDSRYRRIVLNNSFLFETHCLIYKYFFKCLHKIAKMRDKNLMKYES